MKLYLNSSTKNAYILIIALNIYIYTLKPLTFIKDKHFKDRENRIKIFHGINLSINDYKFFDDINSKDFNHKNSFSLIDIDFLIDMGFNAVRINILWDVIEVKEQYNQLYIEALNKFITKLGQRGIYTILVNDQKLLSKKNCGYGIPEDIYDELYNYLKDKNICEDTYVSNIFNIFKNCFSINKKLSKLNSNCNLLNYNNSEYALSNSIEILNFYQYYLLSNKQRDENPFIKRYLNYLKKIVSEFYNSRYVVAIDIWNEFYVDTSIFSLINKIPYYATNTVVADFYKYINNELVEYILTNKDKIKNKLSLENIDKKDIHLNLVFNSVKYPDSFSSFSSYFTKANYSKISNINNYIYGIYYSCKNASSQYYLKNNKLDNDFIERNCIYYLKDKFKETKKNEVPIIINKFGNCGNDEACKKEIDLITSEADDYLHSWFFEDYKLFSYNNNKNEVNDNSNIYLTNNDSGLFNSDNSVKLHKIKALSRPYIQTFQTSNNINIMKYFSNYKLFYSNFSIDLSINNYTTLFIPVKLYSIKGFKIVILYDINNLNIQDINLFDGKGTSINIDKNISNKDLNSIALSYLNFKFNSLAVNKPTNTFIKVYLSPNIKYKYNILHEEQSEPFMKFNIKISDINNPFIPLITNKKTIFYFRYKSNKIIENKLISIAYSYDKEHGNILNNSNNETTASSNNIECRFNEECIIDETYINYAKVMLYSVNKDLIEWEFFDINNHRIIINFSPPSIL